MERLACEEKAGRVAVVADGGGGLRGGENVGRGGNRGSETGEHLGGMRSLRGLEAAGARAQMGGLALAFKLDGSSGKIVGVCVLGQLNPSLEVRPGL